MNQNLINAVIRRIEDDVQAEDFTAIDELLQAVPEEALLNYLPEEEQKEYKHD